MKIYYRQLRGDKYSLINCVGCGNPDVHYQIVEIEEGGADYRLGVNLTGKGYYCSLDCMRKIYPNSEIRAERRERR
jgi:hypothetical protein